MPSKQIDGYLFQFYSSDEGEPPHIHVKRGGQTAKIWLNPVEVAYNRGYNGPELNRVVRLTHKHRDEFLEMWNDHFNQS
ncbi:MAG: DUF4160 domain-containing protein [Caldilineaceae bacterium]|nr:DUF4160 domain-containing protein [Caldilineaceae bacterium]